MAAYEFTTLTCIPGVVRYRGAKIQLLDLPGIIEGAKDGKGRGRQVGLTALDIPAGPLPIQGPAILCSPAALHLTEFMQTQSFHRKFLPCPLHLCVAGIRLGNYI